MENVAKLKSQLWVTSNKYTELKKEKEKLLDQLNNASRRLSKLPRATNREDMFSSRESVGSMRENRVAPKHEIEERRSATLPKNSKDIKEDSVSFSRMDRQSFTSGPPDLGKIQIRMFWF